MEKVTHEHIVRSEIRCTSCEYLKTKHRLLIRPSSLFILFMCGSTSLVESLCKELDFITGMLKGPLVKARKK